MTATTAIEEGASLGKYRIRKLLGRGGMGAVYLAEDTLLDREVAVKLLLPALGSDAGFLARFREEARAVSRLSHPNIVHVNSLERLDDQFVIDMEYVPGMSLEARLRGGVTFAQVLTIAQEMLNGLAACHAAGVVHRDIKPTNVLLTPEDRVKLTDFGIAKAYASHMESAIAHHTSSGFFLGTPHYAPPELWEGASPTPAWDVYSVGVVLYLGLTGHLPYEAATPFALMKMVQSRPIRPVSERAPSVSPALAAYVHKLLSPEPAERPLDALAALAVLRSLPEFDQANLPDAPTIRIPAKASRRPRRRLPSRAFFGAAGLAILIGAFLGLWALRGPLGRSGTAIPSSPTVPASQEEAQQAALLSSEELLARPRFSKVSDYLFFDTTVVGQDAPIRRELHWMMEQPGKDGPSVVVASADRSLWFMQMQTRASGYLVFTGHWAEYLDPAGVQFRRGTISGNGSWTAEQNTLVAKLLFVDPSDRTQREMMLVASRRTDGATDSRFLHALEESSYLQPMIYRALLPRRLEWGNSLESLLPAIARARVVVPSIDSSTDQAVIDGQLDPSLTGQLRGLTEEPGTCLGAPTARGARLWARCVPGGVYLGFRYPAGTDRPTTLRLAWLADLDMPAQGSPYVLARLPMDGPLNARKIVLGKEVAWSCDWKGAAAQTANGWEWEVLIAADTSADAVAPWRLNAAVESEAGGGPPTVLARWGWPELEQPLHGVRLVPSPEANTAAP